MVRKWHELAPFYFRASATAPLYFALAPQRRAPPFSVRASGEVSLKSGASAQHCINVYRLYILVFLFWNKTNLGAKLKGLKGAYNKKGYFLVAALLCTYIGGGGWPPASLTCLMFSTTAWDGGGGEGDRGWGRGKGGFFDPNRETSLSRFKS